MKTASSTAILLAAGSGQRMRGSVPDKALTSLRGTPAIVYCVRAFIESACVDRICVVYRDEAQREQLASALQGMAFGQVRIDWAAGGSERQHSVENALAAQSDDCQYVFIHDCARPLVSANAIQALDQAVRRDGAAVLARPVTDTIKRIPEAGQVRNVPLEDLDRSRLWAMETPQAFDCAKIHAAYRRVREEGLRVTDDTAAAAVIGLHATIVPSEFPNPKLTNPDDLKLIEHLLVERSI